MFESPITKLKTNTGLKFFLDVPVFYTKTYLSQFLYNAFLVACRVDWNLRASGSHHVVQLAVSRCAESAVGDRDEECDRDPEEEHDKDDSNEHANRH